MKDGCNAFPPALVPNPGWFASIYSPETPEIEPFRTAGALIRKTRGDRSAARRAAQRSIRIPEPRAMSEKRHEPSIAISVEHVRKVYGAPVAIDDASFLIARGAVHALLGENGAGKSTIVKLLSGLAQLGYEGGFRLFGEEARFSSPRESQARGIQTAFQEMTLVDDLTVLDNMLLPRAPAGPTGMIRRSQAQRSRLGAFRRPRHGRRSP